MQEHSYAAALPLAEGLVAELPGVPELHSILALCHEETGNDSGALDVIMNARRTFPENIEILVESASILHRVGRLDEAEEELRTCLALTGEGEHFKRSYAYLMLGSILRQDGREEEAIDHLEKALEEDPENTDARRFLETIAGKPSEEDLKIEQIERLLESGRFGEAESLARGESAQHPEEPGFPFLRAIAFWKMGKHRKAAKVLARTIAQFPEDWELHFALGNVLNDEEDLVGAEAAYREALKNPDIPTVERGDVLCALADVLWGMHHREDALDHWKKALECDPRNEEAKEALADCTNEYGEPKSSSSDFDDMYHFMNIHKERYFRLVEREEFETKDEMELVLGLIMNGWNAHVTPFSRELDTMTTEAKSQLFRRVTLDFSPVVRKWGKR